jgi:hypothetical protein
VFHRNAADERHNSCQQRIPALPPPAAAPLKKRRQQQQQHAASSSTAASAPHPPRKPTAATATVNNAATNNTIAAAVAATSAGGHSTPSAATPAPTTPFTTNATSTNATTPAAASSSKRPDMRPGLPAAKLLVEQHPNLAVAMKQPCIQKDLPLLALLSDLLAMGRRAAAAGHSGAQLLTDIMRVHTKGNAGVKALKRLWQVHTITFQARALPGAQALLGSLAGSAEQQRHQQQCVVVGLLRREEEQLGSASILLHLLADYAATAAASPTASSPEQFYDRWMALASEQAAEVVVGLGCTLQHARPPAAGTVWWDADRNMSVPVSQAVVVARCLPVTVKADGCYVRVSANPNPYIYRVCVYIIYANPIYIFRQLALRNRHWPAANCRHPWRLASLSRGP